MICEFAIQLLGGIFVPIEKNAAAGRLAEILGDTQAVLYIGKDPAKRSAALNNVMQYLGANWSQHSTSPVFMDISQAADFAYAPEDIPPFGEISFPEAQQTAEILFSTGTTGKSKGIVLTHGNDMAIAENVMCGVGMKKDNVELIPMPLSHSHGLRRTYANMVNGSAAVFSDGVTLLKKVFTLMDEYHVTAMDLSPSMLSIIFKLSKDRLGEYADRLDYIQLGSAPLPEEDKLHLSTYGLIPDFTISTGARKPDVLVCSTSTRWPEGPGASENLQSTRSSSSSTRTAERSLHRRKNRDSSQAPVR